jgi:hypothetical protein
MWRIFRNVCVAIGIIMAFIGIAGVPDDLNNWGNWMTDFFGIDINIATIINQNTIKWIIFGAGMLIIFICSGVPKKIKGCWSRHIIAKERKQIAKKALPKLTSGELVGLREILIKGSINNEQISNAIHRIGRVNPIDFFQSVNNKIEILDRDFVGNYTIKPVFMELLKKQLHHKLSFLFRQGVDPWFQSQPNRRSPYTPNLTYLGELYTFRIEIINIGLKKIKNIQTTLLGIEPHPPEFFPPFPLQIMHGKSNHLQMTKNARGGLFFDVFRYFCAPRNKFYELGVWHTVSGVKRKIPIQPYKEITIEVNSDNGGEPITKCFRFDPTKKHVKDMMEMID